MRNDKQEKLRKGFIFTLEVIISLLSLFLLLSSLQINSQNSRVYPTLAKFLILSDSHEIIEKGFSSELSDFIDNGFKDEKLVQIFDLIYQKTRSRTYIQSDQQWLPNECEREISTERLVTTSKGFHFIEIGVCK